MRRGWFWRAAGVGPVVLVLVACSGEPPCVALPLEPGTFEPTSPYGPRIDPILGTMSMHYGADFGAVLGTPIYAVADGEVVYAGPGREGRSSELVIVEHQVNGSRFYSWHVHMYPEGVFVEVGDEVSAGQQIAEVGSNGNSTGPHLHFEIHTVEVTLDLGMARTPSLTSAMVTELDVTGAGETDELAPLPEPTESTAPEPGPTGSTEPEPSPSETMTEPTTTPPPSETPTSSREETNRPLPPDANGGTVDPVPFLGTLGSEVVSPSMCR